MTPVRTVIGIFIAIAAAATLVAQAPPQDLPTFKAGVQLIDVDVVVTDKDGKPVRDLTQSDFEIVEDDKPQEIRTFSLIDLPVATPATLAARRADVEPDVVTNTQPEGRTYVLLLDTQTEDLRARHLTERWLDEVVQPGDRVAIVNARGAYSDSQTFTGSRRLILDGINRMVWGRGAGSDLKVPVTGYLDTLRAIKDISERLGTIPRRRKAIVWVTRNPPMLHPSQSQGALSDRLSLEFETVLAAWREAAQAAVNNNVAVYPVDPAGLTPELGLSSLVRTQSFREVAEETGGVVVGGNTNEFSRGFTTIAQDASTYYLLGYSPERDLTDGKFHPIRVRVKRPDVAVRARRGYYAARPDAALAPKTPLPDPPEGVSIAARDALRRPVANPGLGIDMTAVPFKGNGKDASVLITAHVRGKTLDYDAGRRLAVSYQVFDLEGKVASGFYKVFSFNLGADSKARANDTGLQFVERIALKPGRYEVRLVAEQPGGALGSVLAHIDASKFEESLEISGVALASRRANEVPLVGDAPLRDLLRSDPTALRRFRTTDGLSAYAEVYTEADRSASPTLVGVVSASTLTAAITTTTGDVVQRGQSQRVTAGPSGKTLREGYRADFDLARMKPGNYILALVAKSEADRKKTVSRQIPIAIGE